MRQKLVMRLCSTIPPKSQARGYNGSTIMVFTDSQAALKALESVIVRFKLVLDCLGCLDELEAHNSVQLVWVPGHERILGNAN